MDALRIKENTHRLLPAFLGFAISVLSAFIVYYSGGTSKVYTNLMYIPIALIASIYGWKLGVLIALFSGLLVGPFMPITVEPRLMQTPENWIVRVLVYMAIAFLIGFVTDLSRKRANEIAFLFTHDPQTGLKNYDALRQELTPPDQPTTIISLTVTNYEEYMGFFGYEFFQKIVSKFSKQLSEALLPFHEAELYRLYGLEFVIKITHEDDNASTELILGALNLLNEKMILVGEVPVYTEIRIGIAALSTNESPLDGTRKSMVALRFASKNNLQLARYSEEMVIYYKNTVTIASSFQKSLENKNIKAAFQTIHGTETGNTVGCELLARWIRDDGSRINPDEFVPVLEKTELIHNLTSFMVDSGLAMARMKEYRHFYISINFSPTDFNDKCILSLVKKVKDAGVNPSRIQIEITERVLLSVLNIQAHLSLLSRHGFIIVIDDFGTGFSSYRYVADFPIDVIKIDRSLVLKANTPKGFGLVKSIVAFCKEFKITTVAEGVENKEYADICEALGIDEQQGYFYSKPEIIQITQE